MSTSRGTVLISGASIAGPALAYWLHRHGFAVTVVEKASAPRGGGYPIDVRGTAVAVASRMGILSRLQEAHIDSQRLTFLDADGGEVASVRPHALAGSVEGRDLEVARGDLTAILYAVVRDDVEFLFDDSIDSLDQSEHGVDIAFRSGDQRTFDLVVGADGMHSRTRGILFGPETRFHRYLGYCFAVCTMPNILGLSRELMLWNTPGKAAALYATGENDDELHAFLNVHRPEPPLDGLGNRDAQADWIAEAFAGAGWKVPDIIDAMREADDLFSDTVGQIRMPTWSDGRVALVGDAAYAPSFLTGQGSSLALVGAYMLAHSLAANRNHTEAFAAYERDTRAFVAANQALVDHGSAGLFPTTARALEERNTRLRNLVTMPAPPTRPAYAALTLPEPR
ncbi:FAD-dependent monooxygenase [Glycomyces sp. TRM65418]|uniref:FAD-dependent monooxygenase n=1 Tax=Glycomyces sp. TRM65418 TaxID=2867006 RepID=UPI001CE66BF9|nr:FAD-dependent monooxygenase [Glycomyces sp. TRM65418]MCC3765598.1 FAD-dependent monooxygenase [Glycomyces sp. TRM65418]QZD55199.1 FAD-dependent monooxygenase [Glycomyces sp. TRM65418]